MAKLLGSTLNRTPEVKKSSWRFGFINPCATLQIWFTSGKERWKNKKGGHYLYKVGVFGISDRHYSMNLLNELLLLIIIKLHVPFSQSGFSCSVLDQNEANLGKR